MEIAKVMKKTIVDLLKQGKRIDERKVDEFRKLDIKLDISKNAEGSAMVELGKTKVMAGVKIDLVEPFQDAPDAGVLIVNAEFMPLAYSEFEPGPPGVEAIELARIVDRGIRESEFIDFKKLCVEKGKKVYGIFIDIYVLNHDGNLIDASFLASIAALLNARLPKIEKVEDSYRVVYGEKTKQKLPLSNIPFMTTVFKINDSMFIDANLIEEKASETKVSIAYCFDKNKANIHAIQKLGSGTFSYEELEKIIKLSQKGAEFLMKNFLSKIGSK